MRITGIEWITSYRGTWVMSWLGIRMRREMANTALSLWRQLMLGRKPHPEFIMDLPNISSIDLCVSVFFQRTMLMTEIIGTS
jgi:hypothetical protein